MSRLVIADLLKIFKASYSAVLPNKIIRKCISYDPKHETLVITGNKYNLCNKNVYVVGAGKAVQYMAKEVAGILESKIKRGIISIPANSLVSDVKKASSDIIYCEGAKDNLPDTAAVATANKIKELATSLTKDDFLLVLISGGGSALLPLPKEPITLEEKLSLVKKLANSGADIIELNVVRKKISAIKGGKLALAANPAETVSVILSDVVNDPLDIIASGPTVADNESVEKAINIIRKYDLYEELPESIKNVLGQTSPTFKEETVKNYLLGTNKVSILAAQEEAKEHKYTSIVLSRAIVGNVNDIAQKYVTLSKAFCDFLQQNIDSIALGQEVDKLQLPGLKTDFTEDLSSIPQSRDVKLCLILGGETTVEVKGRGKGGRNQQLALEFSYYINEIRNELKHCDVYMLSAGTDGIDGPTDAAGAIGYLDLVHDCKELNIDIQNYIRNNDSYNFYKSFKSGELHVITGHTNTNVMDTHLIIIQNKM